MANYTTSTKPFLVRTAIGELEGRPVTLATLTDLLEAAPERSPAALFGGYLALLWRAGDVERKPIGAELAADITQDDRERIAVAYGESLSPPLDAGDRPASLAVGELLKEEAEHLDKSRQALDGTFFGPDTKALFEKSWDTSERISDLIASLDRLSAEGALRAIAEENEKSLERLKHSLSFNPAADALESFRRRERDEIEKIRKAIEGPRDSAADALRAFEENEKQNVDKLRRAVEPLDLGDEALRQFELHDRKLVDQLKEALVTPSFDNVAKDALDRFELEENARIERLRKALDPASAAEEALKSLERNETSRIEQMRQASESPELAEAASAASNRFPNPGDIRLSISRPKVVEATGTTQPPMETIASAGLQRINAMANLIESAVKDAASHRQSTVDQFKTQMKVALVALAASVLLGLWPIFHDLMLESPADKLIELRQKDERERLAKEKALIEELRSMREEDERRTQALLDELKAHSTADKSAASSPP